MARPALRGARRLARDGGARGARALARAARSLARGARAHLARPGLPGDGGRHGIGRRRGSEKGIAGARARGSRSGCADVRATHAARAGHLRERGPETRRGGERGIFVVLVQGLDGPDEGARRRGPSRELDRELVRLPLASARAHHHAVRPRARARAARGWHGRRAAQLDVGEHERAPARRSGHPVPQRGRSGGRRRRAPRPSRPKRCVCARGREERGAARTRRARGERRL